MVYALVQLSRSVDLMMCPWVICQRRQRPRARTTAGLFMLALVTVACGTTPFAAQEEPAEPDCSPVDVSELAPALPHNLILLMGDGMGPDHIRAARMARGGALYLDALNGPVLYATDSLSSDDVEGQVIPTDSAAAITAVATGVRVENGVLNMDASGEPLETVLELALAQGKSTGLVTTSYVTDASPMGFAVHSPSRDLPWEIATELLGQTRPDVVLGGWTPYFDENDGELTSLAVSEGYRIVSTTEELAALASPAESKVLGLFRVESPLEVWPVWELGLTAVGLRDPDNQEPTLREMAQVALMHLSSNPKGFFLFVEDEQIDAIGHNAVWFPELAAALLPPEVLQLDDAVGAALDWVEQNSSWEDTLMVLFADHECGGYTLNGDDLAAATFPGSPNHTARPVPLYASGPGADRIASVSHISHLYLLLTGRLPIAPDDKPLCY